MAINTHIKNWIDKSDPDYYIMFIKAWIPYNAWYMHNFYNEDERRTSDKSIIRYIQNNPNKYKDKIISLINGNDDDSKLFKQRITLLHYQLESHPIPDYNNRISFDNICIEDNTINMKVMSDGRYSIKGTKDTTLPRTSPRWIFEVIVNRTAATIHRIALYKCSLTELHSNADYKGITDGRIKLKIDECLNEINPQKTISVVLKPKVKKDGSYSKPRNSITIDDNKNLYFINDSEQVSKSIIQIIYDLRCKLFHGELDPTNANLGIYEQAFYIQKMLIKELN